MTICKTYSGKYLDAYDRDFYEWTIDQRLGDPRDLWISDIDALVRDRADNMRLIEIKRNDYEPKPYQRRNMRILDALIRKAIEITGGEIEIEIDGRSERHRITYHGFNLLQLSGSSFYDSSFSFDGEPVSADQLAGLLSFDRSATSATCKLIDYDYSLKNRTHEPKP